MISSSRQTMRSLSVCCVSCSLLSRVWTAVTPSIRQIYNIGVQLAHLVEIDGGKQAVTPAECRVGVDDDVGGLLAFAIMSLKMLRRRECSLLSGISRILPAAYIRCLRVHHIADIEQKNVFAFFFGEPAYLFEVGFLVEADDSGYHDYHWFGLLQVFESFLSVVSLQGGDKFAHIARHYFVEVVKRQIDSMVGQAVLREIVCADFFAPVA